MKKIMMTGVSGYVGNLLALRLLEEGFVIHALARNPSKVTISHPSFQVFPGDVRDAKAVSDAMKDCESAVYLVHGLGEPRSFEHHEALAAQVFTKCSNEQGIGRIVYLGGLGRAGDLSPHLRSRHLTGAILALGRAQVLEFRASIVLGEGSTSTEILKALVSRLPFLIDPANLRELCQPIHFEDMIAYLVLGLTQEVRGSRVFEIGGPDQIAYADLLGRVAAHSGMDRKMFPVPEIDPAVLGEIFELVVPEHARVGRHLIESLTYPTVVEDQSAREVFPTIAPRSLDESLNGIGRVKPELKTILTREHRIRILRMLGERFPKLASVRERITSGAGAAFFKLNKFNL